MKRSEHQRDRSQRGFTLIELMIGVLLLSVMVGMILAVSTQMSTAFITQGKTGEVEQTLLAARQALGRHLRQAGYMMPSGLSTSGGTLPGLSVDNDKAGDGPDGFRVLYADGNTRTSVTAIDATLRAYADVASVIGFAAGDLVVISDATANTDLTVTYRACLVEISSIDSGAKRISFATTSNTYNTVGNAHCQAVATASSDGGTLLMPLIARSYRIDPARPGAAVLQESPSGELVADDWVDVGIGFTNLQLATQFLEVGDATDRDGDGDATRDWYAAEAQEATDATGTRPAGAIPVQVSLSIEARPMSELSGAGSPSTPDFKSTASPLYNRIGDWTGVSLPSTNARYAGKYIYRWSTVSVDLRNMGVGQ